MDIATPTLTHQERVALFRLGVIGHLANGENAHGELSAALRALSQKRFRPPGSKRTRRYSVATLQRWLYRYRQGNLRALEPNRRADTGRARRLSAEQRQLLCDIRAEHPSASVPLILRTLEMAGTFPEGLVSAQVVRRLLRQAGLPRLSRRRRDGDLEEVRHRLRWQSAHPSMLWHGDVCHVMKLEDPTTGKKTPVLVHALLDDCSRYITRLEVRTTEREQDMLEVLANAVRQHRAPEKIYLDNGATYSGSILPIVCGNLGIHLIHATPGDAPARGKMERVFRTMREQCTDHILGARSPHDVLVRLLAWRDLYHRTAHSSLMGRTPEQVWREGNGSLESTQRGRRTTEEELRKAYVIRTSRRVRKDSTLSVDGKLYEVDQSWLAGKKVELVRSYLDPDDMHVVFEGQRTALHRADPNKNARRRRPAPKVPTQPTSSPDFRPADVALDHLLGNTTQAKTPKKAKHTNNTKHHKGER